jgi:hypothetical protein
MLVAFIIAGILILNTERNVVCTAEEGSYNEIVWTIIIFLAFFTILLSEQLVLAKPLLEFGCLIMILCCLGIVFYLYLPIHFFTTSGC